MNPKIQTFLSLTCMALISFSHLGCDGGKGEKSIPIKKTGGGGGGGAGSQKPDSNAIRNALADEVLVQSHTNAELSAVTATAAVFSGVFSVNQTLILGWRRTFSLKIGEELSSSIKMPDDIDMRDPELSLSIEKVKRIAQPKVVKNDMGYLVLQYQLQRTVEDSTKNKKSYYLMILDLNKPKTKTFIFKEEVIYPIPNDFDLEVWIAKQIK